MGWGVWGRGMHLLWEVWDSRYSFNYLRSWETGPIKWRGYQCRKQQWFELILEVSRCDRASWSRTHGQLLSRSTVYSSNKVGHFRQELHHHPQQPFSIDSVGCWWAQLLSIHLCGQSRGLTQLPSDEILGWEPAFSYFLLCREVEYDMKLLQHLRQAVCGAACAILVDGIPKLGPDFLQKLLSAIEAMKCISEAPFEGNPRRPVIFAGFFHQMEAVDWANRLTEAVWWSLTRLKESSRMALPDGSFRGLHQRDAWSVRLQSNWVADGKEHYIKIPTLDEPSPCGTCDVCGSECSRRLSKFPVLCRKGLSRWKGRQLGEAAQQHSTVTPFTWQWSKCLCISGRRTALCRPGAFGLSAHGRWWQRGSKEERQHCDSVEKELLWNPSSEPEEQ